MHPKVAVHTCCPGTVAKYGSLGTNVNTPFFQLSTPELGHGAGARVQGRGHKSGHRVPVCTPFLLVLSKRQ